MNDLIQVAIEAACAGAAAIRDVTRGRVTVGSKGTGHDLVTNADHASENAILGLLRSQRPEDGYLAEESGEKHGASSVRWIIDPLDGTINFARGLATYAVSVAAESDGQTVAAAICQPVPKTLLTFGPEGAVSNRGSVGVHGCDEVGRAVLSFAVPYDPGLRYAAYHVLAHVAPNVGDLRNSGSTVCDLAALATGAIDGYIGFGQAPWDTAAGIAIVHAAGGVSRTLDLGAGVRVVIVGPPGLVETVARIVAGVRPPTSAPQPAEH